MTSGFQSAKALDFLLFPRRQSIGPTTPRWCCNARPGRRWTCLRCSWWCRWPWLSEVGCAPRCAPNRSGSWRPWNARRPSMRSCGFDITATSWGLMRSICMTWMDPSESWALYKSFGKEENSTMRMPLLRYHHSERPGPFFPGHCCDQTSGCRSSGSPGTRLPPHIWRRPWCNSTAGTGQDNMQIGSFDWHSFGIQELLGLKNYGGGRAMRSLYFSLF